MLNKTHAVVFDLYETLITEFDPDWRSARTPAEILGVDPEVFDQVWRGYKEARMISVVDYRDILREACTIGGVAIDAPTIDILYTARLAMKAKPFLSVDPSIHDSLQQLKADGLKLGLISNCSVEEVAAWPQCPLAPLFDATVFSYEFGAAKPDPAIYLHACERLNVDPEHSVFVGDGGSDELAGAARVGMRPYRARWFLDRWPGRRAAQPRTECPQLTAVTDVLSIRRPGR